MRVASVSKLVGRVGLLKMVMFEQILGDEGIIQADHLWVTVHAGETFQLRLDSRRLEKVIRPAGVLLISSSPWGKRI